MGGIVVPRLARYVSKALGREIRHQNEKFPMIETLAARVVEKGTLERLHGVGGVGRPKAANGLVVFLEHDGTKWLETNLAVRNPATVE